MKTQSDRIKFPGLAIAGAALIAILLIAIRVSIVRADDGQKTELKTESFDHDPGWDGFNNQMVPGKPTVISQNFGYSRTTFAGQSPGEIGGTIQRSMDPAYYAMRIAPKTLNDKLELSGTFAITASSSSSGCFFGFFGDEVVPGSVRPVNSLGLSFDNEASGGRLGVHLITAHNKCFGNFVTPYIPGTYRPTPIKADGSVRYTFHLNYDPSANNGNGQFTFTIKGDGKTPANFEGRVLTVDIPAELRNDQTTFTHLGLLNGLGGGNAGTIYFADLTFNGKTQDFSTDPGWKAVGNRGSYPEKEPKGIQNFGFSDTSFAGGKPGEIGGVMWRDAKGGYYADKIGSLSMEDRLEASGKVVLIVGGTDADMRIGWFNSKAKSTGPKTSPQFLGIAVGGPTRVGHYFLPEAETAMGTKIRTKVGPIMVQRKVENWSLLYDPKANNGNGSIRVTLGDESAVANLKPGEKAEGAQFDRFGLLVVPTSGHNVNIYFDDLKYTVAR